MQRPLDGAFLDLRQQAEGDQAECGADDETEQQERLDQLFPQAFLGVHCAAPFISRSRVRY